MDSTRKLFKEMSKLSNQSVECAIVIWETQRKLDSINKKRESLLKKIKDSIDESLFELIFDD